MTSDPIEEIDEEVAIEVVGVATHWDMSNTSSRDKFDDLDEEDDSIGELENVEDDSIIENLSSNSTKGNVEKMDVHDYIVKCESSMMKNKRKLRILKEEKLELSTHVDHLSEQVEKSKKNEEKLGNELALSKRNEEGLKRELRDAR